ncbi:uncharacterized protein FIBRA_00404 [Fibroporia radiculosa]|uniref:Uncharacterized protein n=1 Tax=Fibroporia radiculosa TaxID=599839 RepID=J4HRJ9_9APHY|nr:uncharacterized protein FIBRA_00404 [Fibroporia radiculosa]CCL98407.1 predicted protein [Fibroporia radiculosa]
MSTHQTYVSNYSGPTNLTTYSEQTELARSLVAAKRVRIEDEIIKLGKSILELKSELNTLSPVAVLPPEILAKVFIHHASDRSFSTPNCPASRHWITPTHVCKYWREVALSCPALWSSLVVSWRQEWMDEVLRRSRQAPLAITVNLNNGRFLMKHRVLASILKEKHRFRSVCVTADQATLDMFVKEMDGPAPLLQSLSLSRIYGIGMLSAPSTSLPPVLLREGQAPRLQRLEISKYLFQLHDINAPSIRHLKITHSMEMQRPSLSVVVGCLERLPLLESLTLDYVIDPLPELDGLQLPTMSIRLPHLLSITISASVLDSANFLNHLSLPSLSSLTLTCPAGKGGRDLANCLASKTPAMGELRMLRVHRYQPGCTHLELFDVEIPLPPPFPSHPIPKVNISISDMYSPKPVLTEMLKGLPLPDIRAMHVSGMWFQSPLEWVNTFGSLKGVNFLHVSDECGSEVFVKALAHRDEDIQIKNREDPRRFPYFMPQLNTIVLDDVRFRDLRQFQDGELGSFMESLVYTLTERCEHGAEVQELQLVDCWHLDERDVEQLQETVPRVVWDGITNEDDEEEEEEEEEEEYQPEFYEPYAYDEGLFDEDDYHYGPDFDWEEGLYSVLYPGY